MIRRPSHARAIRPAAAWLVALALVGLVLPASALAQPRDDVAARLEGVAAPNECGAGDTSGNAPSGPFSISGRVTDGAGNGIEGIRVRARTTTQPFLQTETWTNPVGDYSLLDLSDQDFVLSFFDDTAAYQSGFLGAIGLTAFSESAVPVDAGANPTGVNVAMPAEPDPLPTLGGLILDSAGQPVEGVEVSANSPDFPISGCGISGANGVYVMPDVRVGRYVVSVRSETQPDGFYVDAPPSNFATHFGDATPVVVIGSVPDLDIQFPAIHSISGHIRNAADDPVEGIGLSACEILEGGLCSDATSEADGSYSLDALVAGSYVIHQNDPTFTYTSGYHVSGPAGVVADRSAADILTINADVADVDLLAVANPRIRGTVTDSGFVPLAGIEVTVCALSDEPECAQGATGVGGAFQIGVNPETYVLQVTDPDGDHPTGYIGPAGVVVAGVDYALEVTVGSSDADIGSVAFTDGGRISGVIRKDGDPAAFQSFSVCTSEFDCATGGQSDDGGDFRARAVMPGGYKLGGSSDEGDQFWYVAGGPPVADFALGTTINVGTTDVTGIDFDATWSSLSGTPTPEGDDVPVVPTDPATGASPVTLTFDHVSAAGETSLTVSDDGPAAPAGFQLGVPPTWFDISTTADFHDSEVTICISYAGLSFTDESMLRLFHYDATAETWQDRTTSLDQVNDVICGRTDSFSPFAIFQRTMAFAGFQPPMSNLPAVTRANAGEAIKVAFGLGGDFGSSVLASGSPASQRTDCATGAPIGAIEATTSADKRDVLRYDKTKQLYAYNWKTIKSWDGSCRRLIATFSNGTTGEASLDFRKPPKGH